MCWKIAKKKFLLNFLFGISIIIGNSNCSLSQKVGVIDEISSPQEVYRVVLTRHKDKSRDYISLKTFKGKEEIQLRYPLYYEGAFDPTFDNAYPNRSWLTDNIFWLGSTRSLDKSKHKILVRNNSSKVIQQLRVITEDIYLIYDLSPQGSIEIPVNWTNNRRPEILITGESSTSDGSYKVLQATFPFPESNESKFSILIDDDKILIEQIKNSLQA